MLPGLLTGGQFLGKPKDTSGKSDRLRGRRRALFGPVFVGALALAVGFVCALAIRGDQRDRLLSEVDAIVSVFSTRLEERLQSRLDVAALMRDAIQSQPDNVTATYQSFAQTLLERHYDLQALNWVSPDGIIERVAPLEDNRAALGLDITGLPVPSRVLQASLESRSLQVTPPINLAQGGRGFVAYLPVFDAENLLGYLNVVFRSAPLIDGISLDFDQHNAIISVQDGEAKIWETEAAVGAAEFARNLPIDVGGRIWTVTVTPTVSRLNEVMTALDEIVFALGLAAGLLIAVSMWESRQNQCKLKDREERFELAMKGASDGLFDLNPETGQTYYSPRCFQMLGYDPEELPHTYETFLSLLHPDDQDLFAPAAAENGFDEDIVEREFRMRHKGQRWVHILSRAVVLRNGGQLERIVGTHVDITEHRQRQKDLEVAAKTDDLTGLRNRRGLPEDLNEMTAALEPGERIALLHLDLDMFKSLNDTRGHEAGDHALTLTAKRLRYDSARFDIIARVGGDEFLMVKRTTAGDDDILRMADETIKGLGVPFSFKGATCHVGASIGVAFLTFDRAIDVKDAISGADIALSAAKDHGRGQSKLFTEALQKEAIHAAGLSLEIEDGLSGGQFEAHFQPQYDLSSGAIVGFEALARWNNPKKGLLTGAEFIHFAERSNLIRAIDDEVFQQACRLFDDLADLGMNNAEISINMSTSHLMDPDLVTKVASMAARHGVDLGRLRIEILESTLLSERTENVALNLRRFADIGVQLDLDDFGTGHAAISSLLNFPISRVKLDRSLVRNVDSDPRRQAISVAILEMVDQLSVECLAEGVETQEEFLFLKSAGCNFAQGYFLGKPVPRSELLALAPDNAIRKTA